MAGDRLVPKAEAKPSGTYDVSPTGSGYGRSSPDPVTARSEGSGFAGPTPEDR